MKIQEKNSIYRKFNCLFCSMFQIVFYGWGSCTYLSTGQFVQHCLRYGYHHSGCCHITYPHREKRGGDHKSKKQPETTLWWNL